MGVNMGKIDSDIDKWKRLNAFMEKVKDSKTILDKNKLEVINIIERTILTEQALKKIYTKKIPNEGQNMEKTRQKNI